MGQDIRSGGGTFLAECLQDGRVGLREAGDKVAHLGLSWQGWRAQVAAQHLNICYQTNAGTGCLRLSVVAARAVSKVLGGGGLIAGAIGLLPLVAHAAAFVESLHQYKEALHLYTTYVRLPLLRAVGLETVPAFAVDVVVIWLALFAAVNAFIFRADGTFLWGHIGQNYCFRSKQTHVGQLVCRLPKFVLAFVLTPVVCVLAAVASLLSGRTYFTMAYVTLHTTTVAKYLVALFAISTLVLAGFALVPSLASQPA